MSEVNCEPAMHRSLLCIPVIPLDCSILERDPLFLNNNTGSFSTCADQVNRLLAIAMPKVNSKLVDTVLYGEGLVIKARLPGMCVGEETVVVLSFSRYLQAGQF
jgi:hypothetical protein